MKSLQILSNFFSNKLIITSVFLLSVTMSYGDTHTCIASTNWSVGTTWDIGVAPVAGDDVIIPSGFTVSLNVTNAYCKNLTVGSDVTGTATLTFTGTSARTLTVSGLLTVGGSTAADQLGYITFNRFNMSIITTNLKLGNYANQASVISMAGGGVLKVLGIISSGSTTATWTPGNGNGLTLSTLETSGTYTLPDNFTEVNILTVKTGTLTLSKTLGHQFGLLTVRAGAVLDIASFSVGDLSTSGGGVYLENGDAGATIQGTGMFYLGGDVSVTKIGSGTNGAIISCPISLNGLRTFTVNPCGSESDLLVSGVINDGLASVLSLTKAGEGSLTLTKHNLFSGGVTLNAGILNINNSYALGDITPSDELSPFIINGGAIDNTSGGDIILANYPLQLDADFLYLGTTGSGNNLTINGPTTIPTSDTRTITVNAGKLTLGATINQVTEILIKDGDGDLAFAANAVTLKEVSISAGILTSTSAYLTLAGNFSNSGTFNHNSGTVIFNANGTISGTSTTSFNNITISNTRTLTGHATNMNVAGNWANGTGGSPTGVFTHNSGKVTFNGTTTISGATTSFYNLSIASSSTLTAPASNMNVARNWVNDGTFTHSSGTVTLNGSATQALSGASVTSFNNLTNSNITAAVSVNTNINVASSLTMGGAGSILTPAAAVVINSAGAAGTITGTGGTLHVTRTASTADYSSQYKFTTNTLTNLTTEYTVLTGSQVVSGITYGSLKLDNTSGTNTAGGAVTVGGTFTTYNAGTLDMGTNSLSVTGTVAHAGILKTQNTSSTPITTGKTWGGTVQYNATTGGQTVMAGTYNILRNENSSNTNTASGTITATELYTTAGGTLNMVTNDLLGVSTVSNAGTIRTQHTATATPIPSGKTWGGTIQYDASTGSQTVLGGSYTALTLADNATKTFSNTDPTTVSANFTVSGGTVTAPTLITFNGAGAQTIDGLAFNNVTYSTSGTKTMNSDASVAGTLTVSGTAVLDADGSSNDKVYTLKSSASGTARIAANATNNYITGNITVERYLANLDGLGAAKRVWHLLSAKAVNSSQTIKQAWQENGAIVAGKGVWVTSNLYTASNGYDATSASASILPYTTNGTWNYALNNTNSKLLYEEQGYLLFAFGDRGDNIGNATVHPTVIKATGTPTMGNVPVTVTSNGIWTLLGNPYASPLDVEGILTADVHMNQQVYVWDPTLSGYHGFGGYRVVERLSGGTYQQTPFVEGPPTTPDASSRYIHSGQAFFVKATVADVNFNITESMKASGLSVVNPIMNGSTDQQIYTNLMIVNPDNSTSLADGIRVRFDDSYTAATTDDILKFSNTSESLASYRDGKRIMVERRPMINTNDTVFLRITSPEIKNYRLVIASLDFNQPGVTAFLQDNYLGTVTPINLNGSVNNFDFSVTAVAASASPDRFRIVFGEPSGPLPISFTGIKAYQQGANIAVEWKVVAEQNVKIYEIEKSNNGINFNKAATQLATANNGTDMTYNWLDVNPTSGNNFYRIRSNENSGLVKYSAIAKVNIGKLSSAISVYPNPVTGKQVNLQFTNVDKGLYNIRLYNTVGQVVYTTQYSHTGGSATFGFNIGNINSGAYLLELIGADNTKQTIRFQVTN